MKKSVVAVLLCSLLAVVASAQPYSFVASPASSEYEKEEGKNVQRTSLFRSRDHQIEQGITRGDNMVSVLLGAGFPLGDSGITAYDDAKEESLGKLDWGDPGVQYGLSVMTFLTDYLGLGLEISGMNTSKAEKNSSGTYDSVDYKAKYETKMNLFNVMLTARINANPEQRTRVYIPLGIGVTSAKGTVKFAVEVPEYDYSETEKYSATSASLGYFVGLGVETNLDAANHWSLGAETRYSGFTFDTDKLVEGEKVEGKQHYGYLSVLVKLGYRF